MFGESEIVGMRQKEVKLGAVLRWYKGVKKSGVIESVDRKCKYAATVTT